MKLKLLIVCFGIFGVSAVYSQKVGNDLNFIASNPDMHLDSEVYLSLLYKINSDSLIVNDTLTTGNKMCSRFVRVFHNWKLALYYEENILNVEDNHLRVLEFKEKIESKCLEKIRRKINPWPNLVVKERKACWGLFENILKDTIEYFGINPALEIMELSPKDFSESYIVGSPGAPLKNMDFQLLVTDEFNGELKIPLTRNVLQRPIFPIYLSEKFWLKKKKRIKVYIHTEKMFVLKLSQSAANLGNIGESLFVIYNKALEKWSELRVPGNRTRIQAFGNWISGSIAERDLSGSKISVGVKYRKETPDLYGPGFDVMSKVLKLYYPGSLFLYNIENDKYTEWSAGQGDSEVLLVHNEVVIYRIDDSIFQASIINGESLGDTDLLVKDSRVRDIHWAFVSGQ